ncbi:HTH domain-containing protein [Clostridium sp. MCC334]|nr:HTH domain-containing protein [Clostridium sp. MCC334]
MRKPWEYQWDNLSDKDIAEIVSYMKRKQETRGNNPKITNNWRKLLEAADKEGVKNDWFLDSIYEFCDSISKHEIQSMREYQEKMRKGEVKPAMKNINMEELKYLKYYKGWSNKSLAEHYGVTERTIRNRLNQLNGVGGKK